MKKIALGAGLGLALFYLVGVVWVAPSILRSEILEAIESSCRTCRVEIGAISIDVLNPLRLTVTGVKFKVGHAGASEAVGSIESIHIRGSLRASTRENIVIEEIQFRSPDITFVDGEGVSPKSDDGEESKLTFAILKTTLQDGTFTYTRNVKGTSATLHLSKIRGEIGALGTAGDVKNKMAEARFHTRIEKSGEVELNIAALLAQEKDHVDVAVDIRDQNLADVTAFFNPNAGVELKGTMVRGRGRVEVRDQDMVAWVWVVYHGLELKLNPMYDRTKAEAFFMNLGADLVMKDEDLDLPKDKQTKKIESKREPNERIIAFILRGLKEAAIKVAQTAAPTNRARPATGAPIDLPSGGDGKK